MIPTIKPPTDLSSLGGIDRAETETEIEAGLPPGTLKIINIKAANGSEGMETAQPLEFTTDVLMDQSASWLSLLNEEVVITQDQIPRNDNAAANKLAEARARANPKMSDKFVVDTEGRRYYLQTKIEEEPFCPPLSPQCVGNGLLDALLGVGCVAGGCLCYACYTAYQSDCKCTGCFPNQNFVLEEKQKEAVHAAHLYNSYPLAWHERVYGPCNTPEIKTLNFCERRTTTYGCLSLHPKHTQAACAGPLCAAGIFSGLITTAALSIKAGTGTGTAAANAALLLGGKIIGGTLVGSCTCYFCTGIVLNQCMSATQVAFAKAGGGGEKAKSFLTAMAGAGKVDVVGNALYEGKVDIGKEGGDDNFVPTAISFIPRISEQPKRTLKNILCCSKPKESDEQALLRLEEVIRTEANEFLQKRK